MTSSYAMKGIVAVVLVAGLSGQRGVPSAQAAPLAESESRSDPGDRDRQTATPIKHVIIIVGENRSFDHLFATYTPKRKREKVLNLLSEGIVNADGSPGPNFAKGHQFQIVSPPNGGKFFISADLANKRLYSTLPAPDVGGVGAVSPYVGILSLPGGDPGLPPQDQFLFGTGGTGLSFTLGPDTRITNVNNLPPGPFQMTGPTMPFDAFTGDTIHQYFQMYQQMDCAIDKEHVSKGNPTGCLLAQSNPKLWAETAIFITVDEGGGYYDSGFIQPVDFFGTGPRIPMIAVSPFSTGGHVSHAYNEHSSFVKFVERNWKLGSTLSDRSRDNLPNPDQDGDDAYVPRNMPAIGDLFDLFDFDRDGDRD